MDSLHFVVMGYPKGAEHVEEHYGFLSITRSGRFMIDESKNVDYAAKFESPATAFESIKKWEYDGDLVCIDLSYLGIYSMYDLGEEKASMSLKWDFSDT